MISKMRIPTALLALALAVSLAPAAAAQNNAQLDGYADEGGQVQQEVAGEQREGAAEGADDGAVAPVAVSGGGGGDGALPFTGLDLALIGFAGGGLVLLGFGLRRLTRAPQPS